MNDPILAALDHPPRDPDVPDDPRLAAAVMARIQALPAPGSGRRVARVGAILLGLAGALCLVPLDALTDVDLPAFDGGGLIAEGVVAVIAIIVGLLIIGRSRHAY